MLSMRERVPLLRHMASEVGNACRCAGNVRPLDDSSLAASVFIKMLLYHFIGKFPVARVQNATGSPKSIFFGSARVVAILRCFSSPRCFSTAMRINPMTLTKKDQSSKLPATGERANDDPHAASPP
jgi:hypothetical protein